MQKRILKILIAVFLIFFLSQQEAIADKKVKTIVVFFPWNANTPAYQNFLEGFKTSFSEGYAAQYNLLIEYFDIGRTLDETYSKHLIDLYNAKIKTTSIDLIITSSPYTFPLLQKFGSDALKNTPVIRMETFNGLDFTPKQKLPKNTLEIVLTLDIGKTLKSAFDLFPDNKNVYVISGSSPLDLNFSNQARLASEKYKSSHNFIFISGITIDSTIKVAKNIPSNSIILVPLYMLDSKNTPFTTPEVMNIIASNSNSPVFPITDSFIKKEGAIGGNIFSYLGVGNEIGKAASQILNGINANDITVNENSFYQHIYDWQELKKWHLLNSKALPSDAIYYNKESDFLAEYKWYLLSGLLFLILETVLIVYLIKLNIRQKAIARQKVETENLYRTLVREERLLMMVQLTASLSHELSQPLTAILYNSQACLRYMKSGNAEPGEVEELLSKIIKDDKRAGSLISSVRSLMKLEVRDKEKVNLNANIQETISLFEPEALKNHIQVSTHLHQKPVFIYGDKIQLQQVILNLLYNASHALQNVDEVNRKIVIFQRLDNGSVTVSVRDSGPGIEDEVKENLFNPFVTSRKSGLGIGLAVSRTIIQNHEGEIWADNVPEGGAEISFSLKQYKDEY
jgi:signal transduction histidine kinase